jgi:hypothetical protein
MRRGLVVPILVMALALAGCGDDGGGDAVDTGGTSGEDPTPTTTATPVTPISVGEALTMPDGTRVTVLAFVLEPDEGATTLCEVLGESFPPSCGGQFITVDGLDLSNLPSLQSTSGGDLVAPVTWTDRQVPVTGTLTAGRLLVSS